MNFSFDRISQVIHSHLAAKREEEAVPHELAAGRIAGRCVLVADEIIGILKCVPRIFLSRNVKRLMKMYDKERSTPIYILKNSADPMQSPRVITHDELNELRKENPNDRSIRFACPI